MKKMLIACVAAVAAVCGFADGGETTGETTDTTTETTTETTAVGVNFCSSLGADTAKALFECTWTNNTAYNEGSTVSGEIKLFNNSATLTFSCKNAWRRDVNGTTSSSFLNGYFDDGNNGTPITISCTNIPFDFYDVVIYYASDGDNYDFTAPTVNGAQWTYDSDNPSVAKKGSNNWGASGSNGGTCGYGTNVLRIVDRTGYLSIASSGSYTTGHRGSIAAIQIVKSEKTASTMTVGGADKTLNNWADTSIWTGGTAATNGVVIADLQGDATVTVDQDIALNGLTVKGAYQLTLAKTDTEKTATIDNIHIVDGTSLVLASEAITIGCVDSVVTNAFTSPSSLISRTYGNVYTNGAGVSGSSKTISAQGGSITLSGEGKTYYVNGGVSGTQTTVVFDGATIEYGDNQLGVGQANYILSNATVSAKRLVLIQEGDGRTSTLTLNGTSSVSITGTTNEDLTSNSIMFGHYKNGTSVFTLNDESTFTAASQVLVGKSGGANTININGGTFKTPGIILSGRASGNGANGTNKLNINGGTLSLGEVGITSYYSGNTMSIAVGGDATIEATAATLPISQAMTIADGKTLTIKKAATLEGDVTATLSGAISGKGMISFGTNVNVNLSTARCAENDTTIKVLDTTKISATLTNALESFTFKIENFKKENFTLYNVDGQTEIEADVTVSDNNVVTICSARPRFTVNAAEVSLDAASCWSVSTVPTSGDITITKTTTEDATITVPSACTFTNIYIVGSGKVTFKYESGATLNADGATISLQSSDLTLVIDGVANTSYAEGYKNTITGVGKVETLGNVKMTKASSFTGGLTVKSGTLSTTTNAGFGGASYAAGGAVVVEDGASVDLANTTDWCYMFTIAGKGVATTDEMGVTTYSGALFNSGDPINTNKRQMRALTLLDDALISVVSGHGWGLLNSGNGGTTLTLNGYTLTKQGSGSFFICNTTGSAGTIAIEEGAFETYLYGSILNGETIKIFGTASLNLNAAISGLSSLQLSPTVGGVTVENIGNVNAAVPITLNGVGFVADAATVGERVTLVKGTVNTITNGFATIALGGRFAMSADGASELTYAADGSLVSATIQTVKPFLHYDYNQESLSAANVASDSTYKISSYGGEAVTPTVIKRGKTGTSAKIFFENNSSNYEPYFDSNTANKQFLYSGALSVTTVARVMCAPASGNSVLLWNLGSVYNGKNSLGLVAVNETTVALAQTGNDATYRKVICKVEGISNLKTEYHFFAVVIAGTKATLYVDKMTPVEGTTEATDLGQIGQIGAIYGGVSQTSGYDRVGSTGYYLDDWAVYDLALTADEVNALRKKLLPDPFVILVK